MHVHIYACTCTHLCTVCVHACAWLHVNCFPVLLTSQICHKWECKCMRVYLVGQYTYIVYKYQGALKQKEL